MVELTKKVNICFNKTERKSVKALIFQQRMWIKEIMETFGVMPFLNATA